MLTHFLHFSNFPVSLDLILRLDCLINMDGTISLQLRTIRPNQAIGVTPDPFSVTTKKNRNKAVWLRKTSLTFEIFKQCDRMVVAIDNAFFSQDNY